MKMRLTRTKYLLYVTTLLTLVFLINCKTLTKNAMPGGVDFNSLNVQDAKVIKTFASAKANNKNVLMIFDTT